MAQVVLTFDTEDYTSDVSCDAVKHIAQLLTREGVIASFNIVGEVARRMRAPEHRDVVQALRAHEINFHTLRHTWHPTLVEYCNTEDWYEGLAVLLEQETEGVRLVKETFGVSQLYAAIPPGNSITTQAAYGYGQLGIPVYSGSLFKGAQGRSIWYCGAVNVENNLYFEDIILNDKVDEFLSRLDEYAGWHRLMMCCHPNMPVYKQFWDAVNLQGENHVRWGEWKYAERRSEQDTQRYYDQFVRIVRALKAHGGFEFVGHRRVWEDAVRVPQCAIPEAQAASFVEAGARAFFRYDFGGRDYSLADAFFAAAHFLGGGSAPYVPGRCLGPVRAPYAIAQAASLSAEALRETARGIDMASPVPATLRVGSAQIGPGDFVRAAAQLLRGEPRAAIAPGPALPDITGFYRMDLFSLENSWMHRQGDPYKHVMEGIRNQAWTIKMA